MYLNLLVISEICEPLTNNTPIACELLHAFSIYITAILNTIVKWVRVVPANEVISLVEGPGQDSELAPSFLMYFYSTTIFDYDVVT